MRSTAITTSAASWRAGPRWRRLADLVDVSGGRLRFGVQRDWLAQLFASEPRRGLYREIGAQLRRALRERPLTLPKIFLGP